MLTSSWTSAFALTALAAGSYYSFSRHTPAAEPHETVPKLFTSGGTAPKWVALTFDDGPNPELTPKVLRILKSYNAKATFFMIGARVETDADTAKLVVKAGHEVGNHTQMHMNLTHLDEKQLEEEIGTANETIKNALAVTPRFMRPPGGNYNAQVVNMANQMNLTVALWSVNTSDFSKDEPKQIAASVLKKVEAGSVILMHDSVDSTIQALPNILAGLKKKGFRCVTLSELMNATQVKHNR